MLKKIDTKEIMTKWNAKVKYRTKYFIMIITEVVDGCDNDFGYVIYIADNRNELHEVSRDEYIGKKAAFALGVAAEPYPQIGNIVYYD